MGPKTSQLHELLIRLARELELAGHDHWAQSLNGNTDLLERGDFGGIEQFLESFGGMGSLNDLHAPSDTFESDLGTAWQLAKEIEREVRLGE